MTNEPLKFPSGEFTHTELAQLNGKTNQQVWVQYQQAIKNGVIVSAGTRPNSSGRGKPSKLWKISDGTKTPTVAVVAKVEPVIEKVKPVAVPTSVPVVEEKVVEVVQSEPEVEKLEGTTVSLIHVQPVVTPPVVEVKTVQVVEPDRITNFNCPICGHPTVSKRDDSGVTVWCKQPLNVCPSSENPYGHGRNEAEAFHTLTQKFPPFKVRA